MIANPDRNSSGRFTKGNTAASNHKKPRVRRANALRAAVLSEISPLKLRLLANRVWSAAMQGDIGAAEWIAKWSLGKPYDAEADARLSDLEQAAGLRSTPDDEPEAELPPPMYSPMLDDAGRITNMQWMGRPDDGD